MRTFLCTAVAAAFILLSGAALFSQDAVEDPIGDAAGDSKLPKALIEALEKRQGRKQAGQGGAKSNPETEKDSNEKAVKDDEEGISGEDKKTLDTFFEELEELANGSDERAQTITTMQSEYRNEYRENEILLQDDQENQKLQDRQKLIAQYYMELGTRKQADPSRMHERLSAVSDRIRDFRRKNPELARVREFRDRERLVRTQAMQNNLFRGHVPGGLSLLSTMKTLSARGDIMDRWAPRQVRAHPGEAKGALQEYSFTMRRLLRLRWDGPHLALDRTHWDTAFAGQTPDDIKKDVDHLLENRGVDPYGTEEQQQQIQRMMRRGVPGQGTGGLANLARLFQEFNGMNGSSYRGGGGSGSWSIQSESVAVRMNASSAKFDFSFTELGIPNRIFRVHSQGETLSFVVLGEFIHRFDQRIDENGTSLQVTEILDDEILNYKSESFADLYRQQPRYVEERLFPLLEHVGVIPPNSRFNPRVVGRVVELLTGDRAARRKRFDAIAVNLDVNEFTKREAAYRQIRENLNEYFPFLYEKSNDQTLSLEARARISKLLEIGNQNGTAELDSSIAALGLTSDAQYLTELVDVVNDEQKTIIEVQIVRLQSQ